MDEPQILGFSRDTDCMSLTSASAAARRCAGSDLMKPATLAWEAFVLFSVMHALRFGNGNKLPGCVAVVKRHSPLKRTTALHAARREFPENWAFRYGEHNRLRLPSGAGNQYPGGSLSRWSPAAFSRGTISPTTSKAK